MGRRLLIYIIFLGSLLLLVDAAVWPGFRGILNSFNLSEAFVNIGFVVFWSFAALNVIILGSTALRSSSFFDRSRYRFFFSVFGWTIFYLVPRLIFLAFFVIYLVLSGVLNLFEAHHDPIYVMWAAGGIWLILSLSIINGIFRGRFDWKVIKKNLKFSNVPKAFEGFRIVQISDIHIGSFFDRHGPVEGAIEKINRQKPDLILFTGDLVNNYAKETNGWAEIFSRLKAKHGIYSVYGNHDYGEYVKWESPGQLEENMKEFEQAHRDFGYQLLKNEHVLIEKDGESFALAGVENWGLPPFPQHGDLKAAVHGIAEGMFTILMSHDPSHWDAQIIPDSKVDLTLSGHTHGMQFGIEIGNWKWSPVKYRYPRWAGLYEKGQQRLYVNRGFGYIGFPGRVGIKPEITLIELGQVDD